MKQGTGDDPFGDETDTTNEPEHQPDHAESIPRDTTPPDATEGDATQAGSAEHSVEPTSHSIDALPYLPTRQLRDQSVKADRHQVPFFLRAEVQRGERDLQRALEETLDQAVNKTDLREAAYVFAQRHPEGVATVLREWGIEYLE